MPDFAKLIERQKDKHNIENRPKTNVSISVAGADYAVRFGYDSKLLQALKTAIPASEMTWHKSQKVWLVSPEFIDKAIGALRPHISSIPTLPIEKPSIPEATEKSFLLEYLGATKDRGKRESAYGSVNGEWASEFPEDVLKNFFEGREANGKPDGLQTLYQVLCVVESVEQDKIPVAYKRLARQWHPDICSEPDAHERFIKINEAYKILIDPEQRRRYDAGLYFEREGQRQEQDMSIRTSRYTGYGYRAPLRCGQITAKGTVRLMRFVVSEILKWDDVIRDGKVMSSSWPKGADTFQVLWI